MEDNTQNAHHESFMGNTKHKRRQKMREVFCRVYKTNHSPISSIKKCTRKAQCHFQSFAVRSIDSKLSSANAAPLQSGAEGEAL